MTVRPRATLLTSVVLSVVLTVLYVVLWFLQPPTTRALYSSLQLGTLVLFLVIGIAIMLAIGLSLVRADGDGLTVRNGLRAHRLRWSEVAAIRYRDGDPWAYAELVAGHASGRERLMLLGVQQTDGARAREAVAALRRLRGGGD